MNKKGYIIFSGYNQRAIITFCRKLTELKVSFYIIASGVDDFILNTFYKDHVLIIRENKELEWGDISKHLMKIKSSAFEKEFLLCPSSEFLNQFMLQHKQKLAELGILLPLVEQVIYEQVTNKDSFSRLCAENNLKVPRRFPDYKKVCIPFVAKPKKNINSNKTLYPYLILDSNINENFQCNENLNDYFFEQYIEAEKSYYLLFYFSPFDYSIDYSQENILQQAGGKSIVLAVPADLHKQDIANEYKKILREICFNGLIMIELKKQNDQYYLIEANPRLWGPSQLFVDNHAKLFDAFIYETIYDLKYTYTANSNSSAKTYLWLGGIIQNMISRKKLTCYVGNSWKKIKLITTALFQDVYLRQDSFHYFWEELKVSFNLWRV